MSAEPPSSGRPTGPPSGPLSGPSQPGSAPPPPPGGPSDGASGGGLGPPSGPGGRGGAGPGGPEGPGRPWWRSAPRIAAIAAVLVAAVVLAVVLTRPDGGGPGGTGGGGGEVFLQAAGSTGPDPFTESTAKDSSPPASTPTAAPSGSPNPPNVTRSVRGSTPGLYGGTRRTASCDVEKQIKALSSEPATNRAFARVQKIEPPRVPAYLRSLTPVQLRMDTRVTNHGLKDGEPTAYQAVLQAGTAVLVDDRGVPRVRCACGNPLLPPVAQKETPRTTGDAWPGYRASNVVVVAPAARPVEEFVLRADDGWIKRPAGDTGSRDKETRPPSREPSPSQDVSPSDGSTPPPSEPPASEPPPAPPSESVPAPGEPSEPVTPPSEPAPDTGVGSPDGPAPEEAPQSPSDMSGDAPRLSDPARPLLGTVLV
ncbi:DUF6777 domain-containing protein [Streptomyces sp. NPDC096176]|uniref:DUF6777 domain-containing protein n=1 Tax=Streptomyces sp. NPDC096176 TaxID=3366079 RepID=UPI0038128FFE